MSGATPGVVNRHHCRGASGEPALDVCRIEAQGLVFDVREYRPRSHAEDGVGGGDEGERGTDHLLPRPDPEGQQRQLHRVGAGGREQYAVGAEHLGQSLLHASPEGAVAAQASLEGGTHRFVLALVHPGAVKRNRSTCPRRPHSRAYASMRGRGAPAGRGGGRIRPRAWAWPAVGLAHVASTLWLFGGVLAGRLVFFRDLSTYYAPQYAFAAGALRGGMWPLWNPLANGGEPFLLVYPVDLVLLLVGGGRAPLGVGVALHLLLALGGASLLARRLGMGPAGAWLTATVYGLGGVCLSTVNLVPLFQAVAWAPLVVWAFVSAAEEPSRRRLALLAALLAVQTSTLGAEIVVQTVIVSAVLASSRSFWRDPARLARLGLAGILALLLAAPAVLGVQWLVAGTSRELGFTLDQALGYSLHPVVLGETILPSFLGDPHAFSDRDFWGRTYFPANYPYFVTLYIGLPVLLVASQARSRRRLWLLAAAGVLLALGRLRAARPAPAGSHAAGARSPEAGLPPSFLSGRSGRPRAGPIDAGPTGLGAPLVAPRRSGGPPRRGRGRGRHRARPSPRSAGRGPSASPRPAGPGRGDRALAPSVADQRGACRGRGPRPGAGWSDRAAGRRAGGVSTCSQSMPRPALSPPRPSTISAETWRRSSSPPPRRGGTGGSRTASPGRRGCGSSRGWPVRAPTSGSTTSIASPFSPGPRRWTASRGPSTWTARAGRPRARRSRATASDPERFREHRDRLRWANVRWILSFRPLPGDLAVARGSVKLPEIQAPLGLYELPDPLPRAFWASGPEGGAGVPESTGGAAAVRYEPLDPHTVRLTTSTPPGVIVLLDGHHPDWTAEDRSGPVPLLQVGGRWRGIVTAGGRAGVHFPIPSPLAAPGLCPGGSGPPGDVGAGSPVRLCVVSHGRPARRVLFFRSVYGKRQLFGQTPCARCLTLPRPAR